MTTKQRLIKLLIDDFKSRTPGATHWDSVALKMRLINLTIKDLKTLAKGIKNGN